MNFLPGAIGVCAGYPVRGAGQSRKRIIVLAFTEPVKQRRHGDQSNRARFHTGTATEIGLCCTAP
jgi:hypothetical protein